MNFPKVLPVNRKVKAKAKKFGVVKKLDKAIDLFESNPLHPSLHTELLEPKAMGFWSFRLDRKVRVVFIWRNDKKSIEILNVTVHYH